jgi:hypothetical protein
MNDDFSEILNHFERLHKRKLEYQHFKRCVGQEKAKYRKSSAMKDYWKKKKEKEKHDKEDEEAARNYVHESCYCHLGNPPCGFCTDSNYCEDCDVRTLDDECPKCGKFFT